MGGPCSSVLAAHAAWLCSIPTPPIFLFTFVTSPKTSNQGSSSMNRRLILGLAAALAIGACSDQQEPNTENSTLSPEFASTSGLKPVNVVTKKPATPAKLAEL